VPYKDTEKQKESVKKSKSKIYLTTITVNIRRDDEEFYNRMIEECNKQGISLAIFLREAAREKLSRL